MLSILQLKFPMASWSTVFRLILCSLVIVPVRGLNAADKLTATDGKGVISGKIVDEKQGPVADARVKLFRWESPTRRWGRFRPVGEALKVGTAGGFRFSGLTDDYFMVSVEKEGFATVYRDVTVSDQQPQQVDLVMKLPVVATIRVQNAEGQPIAGARVREYSVRGPNGGQRFPQMMLETLGIQIGVSDKSGRLQLPPLPAGDVLERLIIDRPDFAPVRMESLTVAEGASATVTMKPGINVILRVPPGQVDSAVVDLRYDPFEVPSTTTHYEARFDSEGVARLCLEPGQCNWLLLQHQDFYFTPAFEAESFKKNKLRFAPERNQDLTFEVRKRVTVRGRAIDAETGKPVADMSIYGELANGATPGWDDPPPDPWSFAGWGETNQNGEYTIELAPGKCRVAFRGEGLIPEHDYYEFTVAPDGSAVIPEIKVRRIAKVTGIVQNADGSPAARSVVRLRRNDQKFLKPVLTDNQGRFEVQPEFIQIDDDTKQRNYEASVVAFDPYHPLSGQALVRLDKPAEVIVKLEPHDPDWVFSEFPGDLANFEKGIIPPERAAKNAQITLRDQTPPDLDAASWLNTNDLPLKLADLKGKFVLLDFWFTGCGPCHADFPSMKLVHELYKDHGVVVIGVHNNSNTPDEVRAHVAKIGLPFPIAIDHADGRLVARFQPHRIAESYPSYVLISPDGKVLRDDRTIPAPTLRVYKLEVIRKYLLEAQAK